MTGYDANYIVSDTVKNISSASTEIHTPPFHCPICTSTLTQSHQDSVAPEVVMYQCENGHGYYFPSGEFTKFKLGQTTKIGYFKLWQVPFGSPTATLLTTLTGLILSVGLIVGVISSQKEQVTTSQASEIISSHEAYSSNRSVTVIAITAEKTQLTLHIPQLTYQSPLQTTDGISHIVRINNINKGTYTYYFTFQKEGHALRSEYFSFAIK
jgi:hypothetical protein